MATAGGRRVAVVTGGTAGVGRTGIRSQQTERDLPRLGANLFEPRDQAAGAGARGPFGDRAHGSDPLLWLSRRRGAVLAGAAGAAAAGAVAFLRR